MKVELCTFYYWNCWSLKFFANFFPSFPQRELKSVKEALTSLIQMMMKMKVGFKLCVTACSLNMKPIINYFSGALWYVIFTICNHDQYINHKSEIIWGNDRFGWTEATASDDDDLVPKKGATSIVWKWFGYKRSDLQKVPIFCKICEKTVTAKGGNTTNLFHHLKHWLVALHMFTFDLCCVTVYNAVYYNVAAAGTCGNRFTLRNM